MLFFFWLHLRIRMLVLILIFVNSSRPCFAVFFYYDTLLFMDFVLVDMEDEVSHLASTLSNSHGMWDLYKYICTKNKKSCLHWTHFKFLHRGIEWSHIDRHFFELWLVTKYIKLSCWMDGCVINVATHGHRGIEF